VQGGLSRLLLVGVMGLVFYLVYLSPVLLPRTSARRAVRQLWRRGP
jgi:hypothetical protein